MTKDPIIFLDHILESIALVERYVSNVSEETFLSDIGTQDKIIRRLSIIGEAASQLPENIRVAYPGTKWKEIIGMRNFLIHEYFGVTLSEVWLTVQRDLPELRDQVKHIKESLA
ncbi:MAG: DUF86 domain-containing protein [Candidatus Moraniibacteriota bacterium]